MKKRKRKQKTNTTTVLIILTIICLGLISNKNNLPNENTITQKNSNQLTIIEKGIDVSVWQGEINWQKVRRDNIDFAIIRSSYGWSDPTKQTDKYFHKNVKEAKAAGIKVGAYHYAHATNVEEALKEADFFISLLKQYEWDYPVYYDVEDADQLNLSVKELTDITLAFLNKVKDAGYTVGLYASESWLESKFDMSRLNGFEIWLASYTNVTHYQNTYGIWQYTKEGKVKGIKTNVDLNYSYKYYH